MIGPGKCVGVLPERLRFIALGKGRLARPRSEGNGCPFLGPIWVAKKAAISLELGSARWGFAAWTPGTGSGRHRHSWCRSVSLTEEGVHWYSLL